MTTTPRHDDLSADEAALIAELSSGRISAVIDVTDPEIPPPGSPLFESVNSMSPSGS